MKKNLLYMMFHQFHTRGKIETDIKEYLYCYDEYN